MKSTGIDDFQIKRLDLSNEGAALQKAVSAELEWVRRSAMAGIPAKVQRPDLSSEGASLQKAVSAELEWVRRSAMASARRKQST